MKKKESFNLRIYEKNLNNKHNLTPQNTKINDTGKIKYLIENILKSSVFTLDFQSGRKKERKKETSELPTFVGLMTPLVWGNK